jgi:hypothetical protein
MYNMYNKFAPYGAIWCLRNQELEFNDKITK